MATLLSSSKFDPHHSEQTFTILYFASASTYTSLSSETLRAPLPLSQLFPTLESCYPGITAKVLRSCAVTINLEYVDIEEDATTTEEINREGGVRGLVIQPGDEVGIIPPVSSG